MVQDGGGPGGQADNGLILENVCPQSFRSQYILGQYIVCFLKGGYPIIFPLNLFLNSYMIQKCIQNQQLFLILYTFLNQMRVGKNIRRKDDRINLLLK